VCEASEPEIPEAVVQIRIWRHILDNKDSVYEQLPEAERDDYIASLVTPADFSCSPWVLNPYAEAGGTETR
jgi:hypothetical protein